MNLDDAVFFTSIALFFFEPLVARVISIPYYTYSLRLFSFRPFKGLEFEELSSRASSCEEFALGRISKTQIAVFERDVYHGFTYPKVLHAMIFVGKPENTLVVQMNFSTIFVLAAFLLPDVSLWMKLAVSLVLVASTFFQVLSLSRLNRTLDR